MDFTLSPHITNFVLLGEAGCGKSEIAVNLSLLLRKHGHAVTLFDLDQTKPLFRTRELAETLRAQGITLIYEEQFADAPTTSGGVRLALKDETRCAVLDVGGDHIGARAIGAYAPLLNRDDTALYYILNPFRPWCGTAEHAGLILSEILTVSHLRPDRIRYVGNPNLGDGTTAEDVLDGYRQLTDMVETLDFVAVNEKLLPQVAEVLPVPLLPLRRYMTYPW